MIFSVFAIIFSSPQDTSVQDSSTQEYAGVLFKQQGTSWSASVNNKALLLRYNPLDVSSSFSELLDLFPLQTLFTASKIYLTVMPGEQVQLPLQELYTNLKPFTPNLFLACGQEGPGCENLPLKTCSDATSTSAVFFIRQDPDAEEPSLEGKDFCYTLSGKDERDLLFAIDKLLLQLYGLS